MNEEIIKNYERDLHLFCCLAANAQINADEWSGGDEAAICWASRDAFKLAANQMYFHLEQLDPKSHPYTSLVHRDCIIELITEQIIKEKTDHEQKT